MNAELCDKTALITGGAKRLGKAMALRLAREGYAIALHYHHSQDEAEAVAKEIRDIGVRCELFCCDLGDYATYSGLIGEVAKVMGAIDVLVNNASIFDTSAFAETDEANFDAHMDVNFKAPFFLTQAYAGYIRQQGRQGQVVNMLDTYITKHSQVFFTYLLTKKLLADFTVMAAKTLGPHIRVNGIAPGTILPSGHHIDASYMAEKAAQLPLQHTASVEDITNSLIQLIENKALTGQILYVDGGEHLC